MHNPHNDRSGTAEDKKSCYQFHIIYTAKIKQTFVFIYIAKLIPLLFSLHLHSAILSATMQNSLTHFTCMHTQRDKKILLFPT